MILTMDKSKLIRYLADKQMSVRQMSRLARIAYGTARRATNGKGINVASVGSICNALEIKPADVILD